MRKSTIAAIAIMCLALVAWEAVDSARLIPSDRGPASAFLSPGIPAGPSHTAPNAACPATAANGLTPPGEQPSPFHHGNGELFTVLFGAVLAGTRELPPNHPIGVKYPWWRGPGVTGPLVIEGQRIDADAPPLQAEFTNYGDSARFQATGLTFSAPGCWRITARSGDAELTVVQLVLGGPSETASQVAWSALERPLRLPGVPAGEPCPTTRPRPLHASLGPATGPGPVYVVGLGDAGQLVTFDRGDERVQKLLWVADGAYPGPVLIRGRRIDGPGAVRFGAGTQANDLDLRLLTNSADGGQPPGWREWPSLTSVDGIGCHAFQVDGTTFSYAMVFEVR